MIGRAIVGSGSGETGSGGEWSSPLAGAENQQWPSLTRETPPQGGEDAMG